MTGETVIDRRRERHQATRREILDAAWTLVREHGLAGLSMRELGTRVGMRAQSLYSYFSSKQAIYDAMFRQGYEALVAHNDEDAGVADPVEGALRFFDFCVSDPARYQLLFQRTIPDFVPSPESWAVAQHAYEQIAEILERFGVRGPDRLDLWSAVLTGLTSQQLSNDPGGTRWRDLVPDAVRLLLGTATDHDTTRRTRRKATS